MGNLTYQLNQTRIDDLLRAAAERRMARSGGPEHDGLPFGTSARRRRHSRGPRALRRILRPSSGSPAALAQ